MNNCIHKESKVYVYEIGEDFVSEDSIEFDSLNEALEYVGDKHDKNAPSYCPHCGAILVAYFNEKGGE